MQYQISYYSPDGHAEEMAFSFRQLLPSLTPLVDLTKHTLQGSCTHLVGFEFPEASLEEIPEVVHHFLSGLANMEVLVFATYPLLIDDGILAQAERLVLSCLPETCKYRGLYLCQGAASQQLIQSLTQAIAYDPANKSLRKSLKICRSSAYHPTRQDIRMGCRFVADALSLAYYK